LKKVLNEGRITIAINSNPGALIFPFSLQTTLSAYFLVSTTPLERLLFMTERLSEQEKQTELLI